MTSGEGWTFQIGVSLSVVVACITGAFDPHAVPAVMLIAALVNFGVMVYRAVGAIGRP